MIYKASFRDPTGSVLCVDQRVYRIINPEYRDHVVDFIASDFYRHLLKKSKIVKSWRVENSEQVLESIGKREGACFEVLEHEKVWFTSYPYEWPFEMLHAAARLTLDIALEAMKHNYFLKDASPYNVLFEFCAPVFVDVCSFEEWELCSPIWKAQAQYESTFLGPLIANAYQSVSIKSSFYGNLNGLSLEQLYKLLGIKCFLSPALFFAIALPFWLGRRMVKGRQKYDHVRYDDKRKTRFVSEFLLKRLIIRTEKIKSPLVSSSLWSTYDIDNSYSQEEEIKKENAIKDFLCGCGNFEVLDIGCNSGRYSILAAKEGCKVVSIDRDPSVVGRLWERASREKLSILPLVVDFAEPSPAMGWDNSEYVSFIERSIKKFDVVFVLALVHHLQITHRIPLVHLFDMFARITRKWLVIEYIGVSDPMFVSLMNGRDALFESYCMSDFEAAFSGYFVIEKIVELIPGRRCLFFLKTMHEKY